MKVLTDKELQDFNRQSSKGNQLKWLSDGLWYKADYTGYEGLSEYVVSHLLKYSSLDTSEFVMYDCGQAQYKKTVYSVSYSDDFLKDDWQIITLERLFKLKYGKSFYESLWKIRDTSHRFTFISNQVISMTGLKDFGVYLAKLLTIDALFLNEDRHLHNIAVLMNGSGEFDYCPIFDNGACLLSDTSVDYPLGQDVYELIDQCHSKTISRDFEEQLDIAESIVGETIHFNFTSKDVEKLFGELEIYSEEIKNRAQNIIFYQMRRYPYLFK